MEAFRLQIRTLAEAIIDKYIAAGGGSFADHVAFPLAEASLYKVFAFDGSKLPNARDLVHRMQLGFEIDVTADQLADADVAANEYRSFWVEEFTKIACDPIGLFRRFGAGGIHGGIERVHRVGITNSNGG
jgi:hypothetical protein